LIRDFVFRLPLYGRFSFGINNQNEQSLIWTNSLRTQSSLKKSRKWPVTFIILPQVQQTINI